MATDTVKPSPHQVALQVPDTTPMTRRLGFARLNGQAQAVTL